MQSVAARIHSPVALLLTHKDIFICLCERQRLLESLSAVMTLESAQSLVGTLKAAAEPTRLRILMLLRSGPLTVKDLTRILGQSQPRLSRHLKLLNEAGLIDRAPEGSWVYFHLAQRAGGDGIGARLLGCLDPADTTVTRDRQRLDAVKRDREAAAQAYFGRHAGDWDKIRSLYVDEADVEDAIVATIGRRSVDLLVDLGTGTGRILELLSKNYARGVGFDMSTAMLSYARSKLDGAGITHAQVRQGDIFDLPLPDASAGIVVMHQILHFMSDPQRALQEAARILAPGGAVLVVDFAPHTLDYLREAFAHERLGFSDDQMCQWFEAAGLGAVTCRHLTPKAADGPDKLTVSVWLATAPAAPKSRHVRKLESAS
jgi:ubiquinone/menaquinone biosynthesis C-methylase UbiE/DNA-binding transcriptional ArsR family regulator